MRTVCLLALTLSACTGVTSLDTPRRPLIGEEPKTVRQKADEALAKKDYAAAWNHEFYAGADRSRLETIFLAAIGDDATVAKDMMGQLRTAFGGLSAEGTARVKEIAGKAEREGAWERAAAIHLKTASDAPAYEGAWDVYRRAPPKQALAVLEAIQEAREEHEEATAPKRGP